VNPFESFEFDAPGVSVPHFAEEAGIVGAQRSRRTNPIALEELPNAPLVSGRSQGLTELKRSSNTTPHEAAVASRKE